MTVERIEKLSDDLSNMAAVLNVTEYHKFLDKLMEIVHYAKEKAKEDETMKQHIKVLQAESLGNFIDIRETPECKNSAEVVLGSQLAYLEGLRDASNTVWDRLAQYLDLTRNQNGEQLN